MSGKEGEVGVGWWLTSLSDGCELVVRWFGGMLIGEG